MLYPPRSAVWPNFEGQKYFCVPEAFKMDLEVIDKNGKKDDHQCIQIGLLHDPMEAE